MSEKAPLSHRSTMLLGIAGLAVAALGPGCTGKIDNRGAGTTATDTSGVAPVVPGTVTTPGTTGSPGSPGTAGLPALAGPPTRSAGARRLSRDELARSLQRLLGADVPVDTTILPKDSLTPFDNDVVEQSPSMVLVESMESIARDVSAWATTPARLQQILPCKPASATDAACFGQFITGFGRRVLRRPIDVATAMQMQDLLSYAQAPGTFADAVRAALRTFLMNPEFLYRIEPGMPATGGKVRLTAYEVASRLSFLLQGMTPDDQLLAAAQDGTLDTPAGLLAQAKRLIASEEGKQQLRRFASFWLGYSTLTTQPIHQKLRAETDALVDRATEPDRDLRYLLLAEETRIDAELATHYGLTPPASGTDWVSYGNGPRRGILSQGMFAAAGAKFADTSPTRRGKFVRERFLCQTVPLPPPTANIDVDLPPMAKTANACKVERYREHRANPTCAGCHGLMDPIGFGLENYDELGRYRDHDTDRPDCPIDGVGALDDKTTFTGARGLSALIAAAPGFAPCVGQHFMHFALGRSLDDDDLRHAQWLGDELSKSGDHLVAMMLAYVTHDNFRTREE